jgi:hypothetical protein
MEGFATAVANSIFQPGSAPVLVPFINFTVGALLITVFFATSAGFGNIHLYVFAGLALGLMITVNW